MKTKLIILVFALFLLESCASLMPSRTSEFTSERVELGMKKEDFLLNFGNPYKQNFFYNDSGEYCEVLFYRETIMVGKAFSSEAIDMDSVFTFVEGELISQEQIEVLKCGDLGREGSVNPNYRKDVDLEDEE